jgi:hypothetical protein
VSHKNLNPSVPGHPTGITIGDTHYGSDVPHQWHRGWPGMGITHTLFMGLVLTSVFWLWNATERSPWASFSATPRTRSPT